MIKQMPACPHDLAELGWTILQRVRLTSLAIARGFRARLLSPRGSAMIGRAGPRGRQSGRKR